MKLHSYEIAIIRIFVRIVRISRKKNDFFFFLHSTILRFCLILFSKNKLEYFIFYWKYRAIIFDEKMKYLNLHYKIKLLN